MESRDQHIFSAVMCGATLKSVGSENGISRERVRQIVYRLRKKMRAPERLGPDIVPESRYTLAEMRANKQFWLTQLAKMRLGHIPGKRLVAAVTGREAEDGD